jgi:hypothetical protein
MFLQQSRALGCQGFLLHAQGAVFPGQALYYCKQAVDLFLQVRKFLLDQMYVGGICCHVVNIVRLKDTVNAGTVLCLHEHWSSVR